MMKHETLDRTEYSLWINRCFHRSTCLFPFFFHFEYYLNSSKHRTVQITIDIFHDALFHVCHLFQRIGFHAIDQDAGSCHEHFPPFHSLN